MLNQEMFRYGDEPSAIRALFGYGLKRKGEIGESKVFDFSLGNPSIPAPVEVRQAISNILAEEPQSVHAYTPAQGTYGVRQAIVDSLRRRFDFEAHAENLYMTVGAAASLSISIAAVSNPGEKIIVISPFFPEYKVWVERAGCVCVEVPACPDTFQLDLAAIEEAIDESTAGIIINSPNNPVGVVYSEESLEELATLLRTKEQEYSTTIMLLCDEPYRELVYGGVEVPFVPDLYERTLLCYSYSKSLSLPGERIGYILVSPKMPDSEAVYKAVCGAGRALGFVCAPSLFQAVIERCVDVPADIASYDKNRELLTDGLRELGYEFVEPQGAFYLWMKALEPSAEAFSDRARAHELLLVPSTSFGCDGWVRIGYCVSEETIINSMPAFEALRNEYQ